MPAQADEIVVTAQRTGVPVWRVVSPTTTLVLIGSIEGVAKDTKWNAAALTETLTKADRVMFPSMVGVSASPFSMVGYLIKWRKQANLPRGRSLAQMLPPAQFQRLVALQKRGLIKPGFEGKHPLHLSIALRNVAEGKRGYGPSASDYVRTAAKKYKIKMVPIATMRAKRVANDFFTTPPSAYLPCLMDSVALLEAGPGAVKARSDAWAQRRVQAVLSSPAEQVQESCLPPAFSAHKPQDLRSEMHNLLRQKPLTVAVVELKTLARPGGILDNLQAAGYDIRGPRWKD
ncbi:MAG: TraB/GumN family protein [Pseudomonadota bacterium]|nr:TraB/GumN family protein [Pseudomonadota bacterium]